MTSKFWLPVLTASLMTACSPAEHAEPVKAEVKNELPAKPEAKVVEQAEPAKKDSSVQLYGEALPTQLPTIVLESLLKAPKEYIEKPALVSGHVRQACTKKGCWMELSTTADKTAPGCRVTFKDYGFFVPLDSAGSSAKLAGTVTLKVVSKDHVDHLEAEGATFADKNADGTATEVQLIATGVELSRL